MKKERQQYESPVTRGTRVSLESGICSGSYKGQAVEAASGSDSGGIEGHVVYDNFEGTFADGSSWD